MKQESVFQPRAMGKEMEGKASAAARFLKALGSPSRLMILCQLVTGPKNVRALIEATNIPQTSMSQHLARLKEEGIVDYERDHRTLTYRIVSDTALAVMQTLYVRFCTSEEDI